MVQQRAADAVPGRHARRAGDPAGGRRDHRARRRLRGRPGGRVLEREARTCARTGGGQALGAEDGLRRSATSTTSTGRRPSRGPSTGSRPRELEASRHRAVPPSSRRRPRRLRLVAQLQADVLVIGGGATGAGVAWDAALRGFDAILVERADLAEGTSGRFHGLLHSGGRYVVKDPVAADECVAENAILRRRHPGLHRGHRRAVRHDARRRPRLRRPLPRGLRARRRCRSRRSRSPRRCAASRG